MCNSLVKINPKRMVWAISVGFVVQNIKNFTEKPLKEKNTRESAMNLLKE